MAATTRIYRVSQDDTTDVRLIRAQSPAQVIRHISKPFNIETASQEHLVSAMVDGVEVENAGEEPQGEDS